MTEKTSDETDRPDELVHGTIENGIATLTLDSPANRNALSAQLVGELMAHLSVAGVEPSVRAVVVTHTSNTFCAGADLAESAREGGPMKGTERLVGLLRQILELPKPVVALVDGNVRAGGLGLLAACDVAVVSDASSFAFTEARLGVAPAIISLTVLPRLTERAAGRYLLTGERFDATEAARIGLVTLAVDGGVEGGVKGGTDRGTDGGADRGMSGVRSAAAPILDAFRSCSPQGLAETKPLMTKAVLESFDRDAEDLAFLSARLFASEEAREGIAAFMEKRPPSWVIAPDQPSA